MKKTLITIALTVLACLCVVGTTLAFLVDNTDPIVNTFTVGNVDITLTETDPTPDDTNDENKYKLIPGHTYTKDPTITVKEGSEACWLFVNVEEANNLKDYVTYTMADGWTKLTGVTGADNVYYRQVAATSADVDFAVLAGDQVTVKSTLTKADLTGIQSPSLTFTAYAVQQDGITTAADAWSVATTGNLPADTTTT